MVLYRGWWGQQGSIEQWVGPYCFTLWYWKYWELKRGGHRFTCGKIHFSAIVKLAWLKTVRIMLFNYVELKIVDVIPKRGGIWVNCICVYVYLWVLASSVMAHCDMNFLFSHCLVYFYGQWPWKSYSQLHLWKIGVVIFCRRGCFRGIAKFLFFPD